MLTQDEPPHLPGPHRELARPVSRHNDGCPPVIYKRRVVASWSNREMELRVLAAQLTSAGTRIHCAPATRGYVLVMNENVISWFFIYRQRYIHLHLIFWYALSPPLPPHNNLVNVRTSEQKATRHDLLKGPKISFKYCATKSVEKFFLFQNIKLKFNFRDKGMYLCKNCL